jgi:hypothetical protein
LLGRREERRRLKKRPNASRLETNDIGNAKRRDARDTHATKRSGTGSGTATETESATVAVTVIVTGSAVEIETVRGSANEALIAAVRSQNQPRRLPPKTWHQQTKRIWKPRRSSSSSAKARKWPKRPKSDLRLISTSLNCTTVLANMLLPRIDMPEGRERSLETATDAEADLGNPDPPLKEGRKTGPIQLAIGGRLLFKKRRKKDLIHPATRGRLLFRKRKRLSLVPLGPEAQAKIVKRARHAVDKILHHQRKKNEQPGKLGRGDLAPHPRWASTGTSLVVGSIGLRKSANEIDSGVTFSGTRTRTPGENTTVIGVTEMSVNVIKIRIVKRIVKRIEAIQIVIETVIETAIEALVNGTVVETEAVTGIGLEIATGTDIESEIVVTASVIGATANVIGATANAIVRERGLRLGIEIEIVTATGTGEIEAVAAMIGETTDETIEGMTGRTNVVMIEERIGKMTVMMTEEMTGKMTAVMIAAMTADASETEVATLLETVILSRLIDISPVDEVAFPTTTCQAAVTGNEQDKN